MEENRLLTFVAIVDCNEGEESTMLSEISVDELNAIDPLLLDIRNHQGYYPTGDFLVYPDPSPEDLYGGRYGHEVFRALDSRLPTPSGGFRRIIEIKVFSESPTSLYM